MPQIKQKDDLVISTLRSRGVTPTAQRLQIGRLVLGRPSHFSAEQLYERVNKVGKTYVSKATVYNTLGLFVEKRLLRRVLVDPSKVFYDSNMSPHHHFYDVDSGEIKDIDIDAIEIGALPEAGKNTRIEGIELVVRIRRNPGQ